MNSPRMSRVAMAPSSASVRTTRNASSRVAPAMYRLEKKPTIGLGTAGSVSAIVLSRRLMPRDPPSVSSLRGADQPLDLSFLGEPAQRLLREDLLTVDRDLEDAAARAHQRGLDAERLLQLGRQTGGPRLVVSLRAVFDLEFHGGPPTGTS